MKRKNPVLRSLYLLIASAALIALSFFVIKPHFQKEKENKEKGDLLWRDARRDKILEITLVNEVPNKSFSLKRSAESKDWLLEAGKTFDADNSAVDSLISSLLGTKKEDDTSAEAAKVGLDVPKLEVKLSYTNDSDQKVDKFLQLGEDSPVDYQSYAKWKDQPQIFMISKSLKYALDKYASDFRVRKVFQKKLADLKEIQVSGAQNYRVEAAEGGKWLLHLNGRKLAADPGPLSDWLMALSNARASGFPSDDKKDLPKYGLGAPLSTVTLTSTKGEKEVWKVGLVKSGKETKAYIAEGKSESIYEMPVTFVDEVKKEPREFRSKRIASFDKSKVTKFTYTAKDLQIEYAKDGAQWKGIHTFKGKRVEGVVKQDLMERVINSLSVLRAVAFVEKSPRSPSLGLGQKKVQIFEGEKLAMNFEVGNKQKANDTVLWGPDFEDPILNLMDFEQLFPQDATQAVEIKATASEEAKKTLEKQATEGASSVPGKKIMKLEKTANSPKEIKKLPAAIVEKGAKYSALITFKNGRKLKVDLAADKAPYTVSNFIHLARNHFYDGVVFHRVIPNFVAQGGDPTGSGRGGPGYMFDNEDNDLKHVRGSLSMAHAGRNTNGSQFFVVLAPQPHLDGLHTVFGQVTDGIGELDSIKQGDAMATVEIFQEK